MFPGASSKISPPKLPRLLIRKRLLDCLEQHRDKKLILVTGTAAQGKSALALSFTLSLKTPSAWINLGPADSDPVNLFFLIVQSLQRALPDLDLSPLLQYPGVSLGPREPIFLYREWILALLERITTPIDLVLDGLDRLFPEAASHELLRVFLDYLPQNMHLFINSREIPPLEIESRQMRHEAVILNGKELAFTLKETEQFFKEVRFFALSPDLIRRLHKLTEGWVGGLVLIGQCLEEIPEESREHFLIEGIDRFKHDVSRYFSEQIFTAQAKEVQDFLIKSAILDVVEPRFIESFLHQPHSKEILEELAQRNLFIQPVFDQKGKWLYRYHQLFRDFLLNKFRTSLSTTDQRSAFAKAAATFEQAGDTKEALTYYIKAEAYSQAAAILEKIGLDLISMGQTGDVDSFLQALPEELVETDPWLLLFSYICRRFKGSTDIFLGLNKAYQIFEEREDMRGILISLAYLCEAGVFIGVFADDSHPLLARAEELLVSLPSGSFPLERAILSCHVGISTVLYGYPRRAFRHCINAYELARDLGELPLQINALCHAYYALATMGEFSLAQDWWNKVDPPARKCSHPELLALHLTHTTCFLMHQGKLQEAAEYSRATLEEVHKNGLIHLYPWALAYAFMVKYLDEKFVEAEEIGLMLLQKSSSNENPFFKCSSNHIMGMFYYWKGDFASSKKFVEQSLKALPAINWVNLNNMLLSLNSCHLGDLREDAEKQLQGVVNHFSEQGQNNYLAESHMAASLLKLARGRPADAALSLEAGCRIAREKGYYHFFYLRPADLIRLGSFAIEHEIIATWDYFTLLLAHPRFAHHAAPELARLSQSRNSRIARKAGEIRKTIHRRTLPQLRFQTLGRFSLWRGDQLAEGTESEFRQPFLVIKALLARDARGTPKEVIMEDLWPEANPETTESNFKVNLHRLRKALEPSMDKAIGSAYLHVRGDLLILDPDLCSVDAEEFVSLCRLGAQKEKEGDDVGALNAYAKAVELYRGDFLSAELYAHWAGSKREELRRKMLDVLFRISALHERKGALKKATECCKQMIQIDSLFEEAYQKMMLLYARRGMRSAALKTFQECRNAIRSELETDPDEATCSIHRKILEAR